MNYGGSPGQRGSVLRPNGPWSGRAGWSLTSERIAKTPEGLDLPALLGRIESEMGNAAAEAGDVRPLDAVREDGPRSVTGEP